MSLVPTWVRAVNGVFYKNPIVEGINWNVVFDDDDLPELKIYQADEVGYDQSLVTAQAEKILHGWGERIHCLGKRKALFETPEGPFPELPVWTTFSFYLVGRIPVPKKSDGNSRHWPQADCVVFDPPRSKELEAKRLRNLRRIRGK